jgi:hypothetical protein
MEQYLHLLIARPDDFVPEPHQIKAFFEKLFEHQVVPNVESISVSTQSDKIRTGKNPVTGETVYFPILNVKKLKDISELDYSTTGLSDLSFVVSGQGRPSMPPIAIDFAEPYSLTASCNVKSVPHSTSGAYNENGLISPFQFNKPCPDPTPMGYFTDPTTNATVEVSDAGRARFWVEFELGKWLFPTVHNGDLEILNPTIVVWAERDFGIKFAQGCRYF